MFKKILLAAMSALGVGVKYVASIKKGYQKARNGGNKTGAAALKRTANKRKNAKAKSSKRK